MAALACWINGSTVYSNFKSACCRISVLVDVWFSEFLFALFGKSLWAVGFRDFPFLIFDGSELLTVE